mgnify:CR=1 FL=1
MEEYPGKWGFLTGIISFLIIWIYAMSDWGLLLGLMFGWIPALIGGVVLAFLWPLVILAMVGIIILLLISS